MPLANERAALLLLLAAAVLLRAIHLDAELWADEVFTLVDFVRRPFGVILTEYPSDNQHLVYSLLARLSVLAFGENAVALRLPAAALGVAGVWATWRLGRLLCGPRQALLAAALLALSYHHVWFSQNARGYTGLLFATVLSTDLWLRFLERGRKRDGIGFAAASALGFGFHLTMLFVSAAQAAVALGLLAAARARPRRVLATGWPLALGAALTLLLHAGVLGDLLSHFSQPGGGTTTAPVVWKSPLWLVSELLRGLGGGRLWLGAGVAGAAAVVGGAGAAAAWRRSPAALLLFALPAVLGAAALLGLGRNLWPRFFLHELGFAAILGAQGLFACGYWLGERLPQRPGAGARFAFALGALALLASAALLPRNYRLPKQDFAGALAFVERERAPGDPVAGVDLAGRIYRLGAAPGLHLADRASDLLWLRDAPGHAWVIYTLPEYLRAAEPNLVAELERDFEQVAVFPGTLGDGAIIVMRERDPGERGR